MLRSEIFSTVWAIAASRSDDPHRSSSVLAPVAKALRLPLWRLRRWFDKHDYKNLSLDQLADLARCADAEIVFRLQDRKTGRVFACFGPEEDRPIEDVSDD